MWYRIIKNVSEEIDILKRRISAKSNRKSRKKIKDYVYPKSGKSKTFTRLSAFQFIQEGKSQLFFEDLVPGVELGIVLFDDVEREVYWRDSPRGDASNDAFAMIKKTKEDFASSLHKLHFVKVTEAQAANMFSESWTKQMLAHEKYLKDNNITNEEYPYLMAWTEGLFRYKVEDVKYVVCCEENLQKANEFVQFLQQNGGKPQGLVDELYSNL